MSDFRVKDAYPEEEDFVDDQLGELQDLWEKLQVSWRLSFGVHLTSDFFLLLLFSRPLSTNDGML